MVVVVVAGTVVVGSLVVEGVVAVDSTLGALET